jgi:general secretion pathway protein C
MRALQIALGIACLAVVYTGLAPVLRAGPVVAAEIPPIEIPAPKDSSLERYRVIGTRNLFRTRATEQPVEAVSEDLKESALRLKLCGTYAAQPSDRSVACIDDQGTQKRRAFRVGQEVSPGVRLIAVERRRAVIDNRGAREQLSMEEAPAAGAVAPGKAVAPRAAPAGAPPRAAPRISDRLRQLRDRAPAATAPPAPPAPTKLQNALDGAQFTPVYDDAGSFGGVKLSGIRPTGPFAGMPENTVCFEVNGNTLDGVQALPAALVSNADGEVCLRCRQPDGAETTRCL